jgi:phosphohistidine phosphatase
MRLIIVRHAIAVPRGTPDVPEEERPLSPEGERKFQKAARGLALLAEGPDLILTSPLPRALRTAEIAAAAWGGTPLRVERVLLEGTLDQIVSALAKLPEQSKVVIVGHEPTVSSLVAGLLGSARGEAFELKKGGAACIETDARVTTGQLLWYVPPRVLRDVADGA